MVNPTTQAFGNQAPSNSDNLPASAPISSVMGAAGYAAPAAIQSLNPKQSATLATLATKTLQDPLLMRKLADHVYDLMREDLVRQQERMKNYGGSF